MDIPVRRLDHLAPQDMSLANIPSLVKNSRLTLKSLDEQVRKEKRAPWLLGVTCKSWLYYSYTNFMFNRDYDYSKPWSEDPYQNQPVE